MTPELLNLQVAGIKQVRHRPTTAWAVELTAANVETVGRWVFEHSGELGTRSIRVNDPNGGWRELEYGDVIMRGTRGEFYGITKETYMTNYEDLPQDG